MDNKNIKKKEKKQFSITLDKEIVDRIHYLRKIENTNGYDTYKSLSIVIKKWLEDKEKLLNIKDIDHKDIIYCPKCNAPLTKRKSGEKSFLGCSSFPKCKYSLSL